MTRRLKVSLDRLAAHLTKPGRAGSRQLRELGPFHVLHDPRKPPLTRRQTFLVRRDQFALLLDEFHGDLVQAYSLTLEASAKLRDGRRRLVTRCRGKPVAVHLLGDYYPWRIEGNRLHLAQAVRQGRFLVALTADTEARVRILHGWSVEIRTTSAVFQLLHSNLARRLLPFGGVQTDALFGLAELPGLGDALAQSESAKLHLLQATQMQWPDGGRLQLASPCDLIWGPSEKPPASKE